MQEPADELARFITRAGALVREVRQFTLPLSNLVPLSPIAWNHKSLDPVPFSRAMFRLEDELATLAEALIAACGDPAPALLDALYKHVEPAFRVVFAERRNELLPADSISLYLEQQQILIFMYAGRTSRFIRSPYQEIFLRQLTGRTLATHPFLSKETLERAGAEVTSYAKDFLRALQLVYKADVEAAFRHYHALLVDLHECLCAKPVRVPTYAGITPRRIAGTSTGVVSRFVAGMREMPDLDDAQREHILTLRDADSPVEGALYRRLARSADWGGELAHIVAFLHQRNQDPLSRYTVFEAGSQGELEPVEIGEAASDQVIDQEKNVSRLRTLLTAFVKGSHLPFVLLEGEGGVGKTLSLQALVREIEGLKLVLISSDCLGQIRQYAQRMAEEPWRTVLYIDDMTFDPRHYESFKTGTQGMKQFYENVTVIASANPASLQHLPPEVLRRWPIRIHYERPNLANPVTLEKIFRANCERVQMPYERRLVVEFRKQHRNALGKLAPSSVHDFLQEAKATRGL